MSRAIKFRAWDKKQKKMLYGVSIGTIKVWDENAPIISHEFSYSENCVFEQYTGLKDKNGKEIYEGDILQIDDHVLGDFEVVWQGLGWKVKRSVGYETLAVHKAEDIVVVGNIHENPELIGGEE
jgi:uncharacterized phage protein (TIGR01671 family)